jgi:hypothetical protein
VTAVETSRGTENLVVSLTSGTTHLVVPERSDRSDLGLQDDPSSRYTESGLIYHDLPDMPSLQKLLEEHQVSSAIWERDAGPPWRAVIATAIAAAIGASGWVLFASGLPTAGIHVNALLGLMVGLGGVGLLVTVVVALRK